MGNRNKAQIRYQILVEGTLQLDSPLLIGSGQDKNKSEKNKPERDIHVLKDQNNNPFIPGTSITGVLRHMLYGKNPEAANILFGYIGQTGNEAGLQSSIIISDVLLKDTTIVVRDGVCIDPDAGTAKKGQKYNYEAIERSTSQHKAAGKFHMVVTVRVYQVEVLPNWQQVIQDLVNRLAVGIRLGALTAKGFGRVSVPDIQAGVYDMTQFSDVKKWLLHQPATQSLKVEKKAFQPKGAFIITGQFALKTSLLVRNKEVSDADRENKIHAIPMKSGGDYLIPGTSVKGALRHQAVYILRTMGKTQLLNQEFDKLMGCSTEENMRKSRFMTDEVYIQPKDVTPQKQTRNAIDRFTGSTMDSKLFAEQALWQKDKKIPTVILRYTIDESQDWERGMALFLLKDLWTGNVALGGDKSVGRGYLQGLTATIQYYQDENILKEWKITDNGKVVQGDPVELEAFASALVQHQ